MDKSDAGQAGGYVSHGGIGGAPAPELWERRVATRASWLYGMTVGAAKFFDNGNRQDQDAVGRLLDGAIEIANEVQGALDDLAEAREFSHRPGAGRTQACCVSPGLVSVAKWFDEDSEERPLVDLVLTPGQARQLARDLVRAAEVAETAPSSLDGAPVAEAAR